MVPACGAALQAVSPDSRVVALSGAWVRAAERPGAEALSAALCAPAVRRVGFDDRALTQWDSTLLAFLLRVRAECLRVGIEVDFDGLRQGLRTLLRLATAVPEHDPQQREPEAATPVHSLGQLTIEQGQRLASSVSFVG